VSRMTKSMPRSAESTSERAQASIGEIFGDLTRDFSTLVRQEVELAKAEVRQEAKAAGKAGGMFGGVAIAAGLTLLFLSYAAWWGLANVMDQAWAALIVAAIWAVIGGVLFTRARREMRNVRGLPRTQQTAREIPQTARDIQQTVRNR
jgi:Putative Actinobacterial Holin-X, holin superfamily III